MESWKEYGQNPVTHSAAHHLVAIENLIDEYGYARVTDVAKRLAITRGSVSLTIKNLKSRGLVSSDARGFLRLTGEGLEIVRAVQARKSIVVKLLTDVLGVDPEQANIDACKIEHLISGRSAEAIIRLLRFLESNQDEVRAFREAFALFDDDCSQIPEECPVCGGDECIAGDAARMPERTDDNAH